MEIFLKPLGMGAVAVFIGIVLLWLIPEYKKTPRKAAVAVISLAAKIVAADFTKFSFSWRKSHSK
ncbi:hypothetical protein DAN72_22095 [Salmonella enterica subsp. enterica serovar Enteritidis]|nr:hypothetical protein [Salmonella enterica subsp. enterica serovar Enteritidis]